ncbi:hypothetical protein KJS94_07225 [Flavihumibacter rivuli]|uniref:hypothetical protein n=1 Tax=Flavihumibacter rivuli TaxID=2838156 RepID=UPI001BDF1B5D|nr:hypothetical protein [Flavihumibacter rivuli]ULQ57991.1 hypothetical protein KJS94_07225 [Flavihumibacter rivuli]
MKVLKHIPFPVLLLVSSFAFSQDTSKRKTIEITSTFKPVLREPVKLNFSAVPPQADSSKPNLAYAIPQQNVTVPFQPGSLSPVAFTTDSILGWRNDQYLKIGVGNVHLPYVKGGISLGEGTKSFFSISGEYYSSKGRLDYQKNNLADLQLRGTFKLDEIHELTGRVGFKGEDYFLYGYRPDTLEFTKTQIKQRFQTADATIDFRSTKPNEYGISYSPRLTIAAFSGKNDDRKATENNLVFELPVKKTFGKSFGIDIDFTADLTRYNPTGKESIKNNLVYVEPALFLKTPNLFVHTAIIPSWDNKVFALLPNILAELTTNDQRFTVQAGWIGYYNKGSYQRFASINPWLAEPERLLNTRVQEMYAGFKGSLANHFTYSAKASYGQEWNVNLFVNDTVDGKTFNTVYSPKMEILKLHGEIGYTLGEDLSFSGGVTYRNFSKIDGQTRAWGLLPLEVNASLRWKVLKDLYFKSDLWAWDGAAYQTKQGEARKGETGFDLNAGLEFRVTKGLNLWLQMNNLFNNRYERWNQYEVYGFNLLGGVVFNFNQK